ncbi:hypothetical protein NDU88_003214 [Pleurodeles waltl]|uniref:Uncharacterized protein n=1 Tax=Pleurodeles waltl TaxID=8319 RepID=A0AAV7VDJ5_PLEWA|nr:hypothetical protein NDU88_003214 [Pleurodeles waltl]
MQGRCSRPKIGLNGRASYLCFRSKMAHGREADLENGAQPDLHQKVIPGNYGGHSDRGGRRSPPAKRFPPKDRPKDCGGHSGFPTGPAGDRKKTAGRPSGTAPSTMKPARNGVGGVEGVRRVQWHPSRFSLSAKQTVKIFVGPC